MDVQEQALDYFRKLVSFLYCEIGFLTPHVHPTSAAKRKLASRFFDYDEKTKSAPRKPMARLMYFQSVPEIRTKEILRMYEETTGLSLQDVCIAFEHGNWVSRSGFGGPKWAEIAKATLELEQVLEAADWGQVPALIRRVQQLGPNNGRIVDKFKELAN